jgi:FkbM family methyltransferase
MNHYTLKHRIVAAISQRLFSENVYVARRGLVKGLRRKGGLGFIPTWLQPDVETAEYRCLRGLDLQGKLVLDIGAFHGLTALFFASRGARVHAFEPMPANRARLQENLALNTAFDIQVHPIAVGGEEGVLHLLMDPRMPGGATASAEIQAGVGQAPDVMHADVPVTTLDALHAAGTIQPPDFVKIDVEGFEANVLAGGAALLAARQPTIYLELHGETPADKRAKTFAVLTELERAGYDGATHVELGSRVRSATLRDAECEGHLLAVGR